MKIEINKLDKTPVYLQISGAIREMILDGRMTDGYALPSERKLAAYLDVHRNTVTKAYMDLKSEGLIDSHQGKGYRVAYRALLQDETKRKPVNWESMMNEEYAVFESDFDTLYSKSFDNRIVSFGGGVAASDPYPAVETAAVFAKILQSDEDKAYFYAPFQGDLEFRREIVKFMASKGIQTTPGEIQVFSENNQALDFIFGMMLSPGDKIVLAEPTSPDIVRAIQLAGAKALTVPLDEQGMMCDHLEVLIEQEKPRFIYVDSSFNNPTGVIMPLERRLKLLELSYKYRIPIIEDDEGSELSFEGEEVHSLKSMDAGSNVIYMYSFSLTMVPGIGVSFMVADKSIIRRISDIVSLRIASPDWAAQMVTREYMRTGLFYERLNNFRQLYKSKRDYMCELLQPLVSKYGLEFRKPEGGVYLWIKLPEKVSARAVQKEAQKRGLIIIPGYVFFSRRGMGENYIRLNFSYPSRKQIEKGVRILGEAFAQVTGRG